MVLLKSWLTNECESPNYLLLDGGVSTHLRDVLIQERGIDPNHVWSHRSLWSSSLLLTEQGRSDIERGHADWLQAGCNIITTVTYQCHYDNTLPNNTKHSDSVDDDTMTEMLRTGVRLAKCAIATSIQTSELHFVVASEGCFGAALANGAEYTGNYPGITEETLMTFHRRKVEILLEENPDGIAFETIPSITEFVAILKLLKEMQHHQSFATTAVWLSLACRSASELNDGTPILHALNVLRELDPNVELVQAIGFNCFDIQFMSLLIQRTVRDMSTDGSRRGIVIYPNTGEEWDALNERWKTGTGCVNPSDWANRLVATVDLVTDTWRETNATNREPPPKIVVGGCCRTTPETIAALRKALDDRSTI